MTSNAAKLAELQAGFRNVEEQLEKSQDRGEALELAIQAAQLCMQALKIAVDGNTKSSLRSKANSFLSRAESIKNGKSWSTSSSNSASDSASKSTPPTGATSNVASSTRKLKEPVNSRPLSIKERELVLRGSRLNGYKFPPWEKTPQPELFKSKQYTDDLHLRLSRQQMAVFKSWDRAADALPPPSLRSSAFDTSMLLMTSTQPLDLVQDAASDCSVVASLCAIAAREERGLPTMLRGMLYPFDQAANRPLLSSNGLYIVRLNFNGAWRIVMIDDFLPVSRSSHILHTVDLNCPNLLWPALIEKAYLKVRGGYDFPGSNSCTDLWVLSGWIPEQILLQDEETDPYAAWSRMRKAFQYGDVLVSLGTGKMSRQTEQALGLAAEHNYAVLDFKEEGERRMLLLKNPWREGRSLNAQSIVPSDKSISDVDDHGLNNKSKQPIASVSGASWVEFNEVLQSFESIYLNWNPGLFGYRADMHFHWNISASRGLGTNFVDNPQFAISCKANAKIWLLLCRHFEDSKLTIAATQPFTTATLVDTEKEYAQAESTGYMSLYAFEKRGQRVRTHDNPLKRSQYIDSPQILLQLQDLPNKIYTIVPSEQGIPAGIKAFTLIAFSSDPVELSEAANNYPQSIEVKSSWSPSTAGGNGNSALFPTNPQFKLVASKPTRIAILLESATADFNVNVKLLFGGGKRAAKINRQDILSDSGDYRTGSASVEIEALEAGSYTVICSTFESGQEGRFRLRVDSAEPCQLTSLPSEMAGRFKVDNIHTAVFQSQDSILAAPLRIQRTLHMTAIAKVHISQSLTRVQSRSPIRLAFKLGYGESGRVLAASSGGEFDSSESGIRTTDVSLWPQMGPPGVDVWLVLERMSPPVGGEDEGFKVEILVDGVRNRDWDIGPWRVWSD